MKIITGLNKEIFNFDKLENFPFLPVNIFKSINLKSIPDENVLRIMNSSGTTGLQKTKIYLDRLVLHSSKSSDQNSIWIFRQ